MGNVRKRVKYGRYYYLEYFLVGFLTKLCLYIPQKVVRKKSPHWRGPLNKMMLKTAKLPRPLWFQIVNMSKIMNKKRTNDKPVKNSS